MLMRDDIVADEMMMQQASNGGEGGLKGELFFKWGGDGASGQSRYKIGFGEKKDAAEASHSAEEGADSETDSEADSDGAEGDEDAPNPGKSDASVWTSTLVPLALKVGDRWVINYDSKQTGSIRECHCAFMKMS